MTNKELTIKLPVTWSSYGTVEVVIDYIDAESKEDTIKRAKEMFEKLEPEIGLPDNEEYLDDSFGLSTDDEDEVNFMIENINVQVFGE